VNGQVLDITAGMKLDRYKTHDRDCCGSYGDRNTPDNERLSESINTAMHHGENVLMVLDQDSKVRYFSRN
jgi:excinuclease ABC subunit A